MTEPMDRSMPAVMITNVIPTPRMARMDAFCTIRRMLPTLAKVSGSMAAKTSQIAMSTSRIWNACTRTMRVTIPSARGSVTAALMLRSPSLRSWR